MWFLNVFISCQRSAHAQLVQKVRHASQMTFGHRPTAKLSAGQRDHEPQCKIPTPPFPHIHTPAPCLSSCTCTLGSSSFISVWCRLKPARSLSASGVMKAFQHDPQGENTRKRFRKNVSVSKGELSVPSVTALSLVLWKQTCAQVQDSAM